MPTRSTDEDEGLVAGGNVRRPDPDPTARTLVLVDKAIASLREELKIQFEAVEKRFQGIDRATQLVHDDYVRVPTVVDKAVGSLRDVFEVRITCLEDSLVRLRTYVELRPDQIESATDHLRILIDQKIATAGEKLSGRIERHVSETLEKFSGVAAQFNERDTRTDQRAGDTKLAVDAAFAAAKEATAKIEAGFTKQIDGMAAVVDTKTQNLDSRIQDLKDRLTVIESRGAVMDPAVNTSINAMMTELRSLRSSEQTLAGKAQGFSAVGAMIMAGLALLAAIIGPIILAASRTG